MAYRVTGLHVGETAFGHNIIFGTHTHAYTHAHPNSKSTHARTTTADK